MNYSHVSKKNKLVKLIHWSEMQRGKRGNKHLANVHKGGKKTLKGNPKLNGLENAINNYINNIWVADSSIYFPFLCIGPDSQKTALQTHGSIQQLSRITFSIEPF